MKTIEEHLQDLQEPHRSKALKNMWWEDKHVQYEDPAWALHQAFNWSRSPEGYEYWHEVWYGLKKSLV